MYIRCFFPSLSMLASSLRQTNASLLPTFDLEKENPSCEIVRIFASAKQKEHRKSFVRLAPVEQPANHSKNVGNSKLRIVLL